MAVTNATGEIKLNPRMNKGKIIESNTGFDEKEQVIRNEINKAYNDAIAELNKVKADKKAEDDARKRSLIEKRANLLHDARLLKNRADELTVGSVRQLVLLEQAEKLTTEANFFTDLETTNNDDVVVSGGWFSKNKNVVMALAMSCILAMASWYVMRMIKVEDPQAVPYDATTFQKFLLTLCFFCALQAVKSFSVLIYYPVIHLFKSNVHEPSFDFSLFFRKKLTPIQQVCISIFIPFWFALEFILLFMAKV